MSWISHNKVETERSPDCELFPKKSGIIPDVLYWPPHANPIRANPFRMNEAHYHGETLDGLAPIARVRLHDPARVFSMHANLNTLTRSASAAPRS